VAAAMPVRVLLLLQHDSCQPPTCEFSIINQLISEKSRKRVKTNMESNIPVFVDSGTILTCKNQKIIKIA
jgi:cephalosporin-C deacetylase-like acetyl esterase